MSHSEDNGPEGQELSEQGAEIEGPDGADSPSSGRRAEANRRNAKRSTGPRTPEGKARSSKNATKAGVFVATLGPITKGPFEEDPEEFADQAEALISAHAPRDALEVAGAVRITSLMIGMDRLDRWGMALIEGESRMTKYDFEAGIRTEPRRRLVAKYAYRLAAYLENPRAEDEVVFSIFATLVRTYGPAPLVEIPVWDGKHEPQSPEDWKVAFEALRSLFWPRQGDAKRWADALALQLSREAEAVDGLEEQIAANRILNALDRLLKYQARLRKEYQEMRKDYEDLRKRPLTAPGKNEPNDPEGPQVPI
jgi:hypothetical protein